MFNPKNAPFAGNVPTENVQEQTNTEIPTQQVSVPSQPVASTDNLDVDNYDDVAQTIEVGEKVSDYPVDKYRAVKGKVDRIAILSRKWKAVKSHFEKGMGSFYCFDGVCCQSDSGRAKRRYLVPVLVYETDIKGEVLTKAINIQYLVLSGKDYEPLAITDAAQQINTMDLKIICNDEQYQSKTFMAVPGQALWLQDAEFKKAVAVEYQRLEPYIIKAFARKLGRTPEESETNYLKSKKPDTAFEFGKTGGGFPAIAPQTATSGASPVSEAFDIDNHLGQ